jgi:hypothetical protein
MKRTGLALEILADFVTFAWNASFFRRTVGVAIVKRMVNVRNGFQRSV